ncbi:MAG TPA: peptidase [Candidatus Faecalibacterium intestinigallinarum]|uniref:Peptidase n=1 Tax=Candidatus Faecalibacterium intestinigallinarum TaxID=2838581 RepID=A0A9D1TXQ6_9FIRM|nr:peptidase [Candidatus Faecalibacterium intestinigallinarum]
MVVRRLALLIAAAAVVLALYTLRLIFLQLVHGEEFAARATSTTEYRFNVTAARGDIVDSAGRRIATSTTCYNVELSRLLIGDNDLNETIRSAVEILQANGESWNDTLLIGYADGAGHYAFTGDADSTSDQNAIARVKEALGLQQYATADDVMDRLIEEYELEGYDPVWQRILGGIHYQMEQEAFSNVNNFVLAEDVSDRTVATVKEYSLTLPGVEIAETSVRSYTDGTILPHVLGRVGKITAEMWRVTDENGQTTYPLRDRGYAMNDVIGISGLESAYEEQLRGQDGVETITRDSDGVIIDTSITTEPQPGKTVMLTVNSEFQKAVDEALARNVQQIADTYGVDASAGAVVVIDVKNGGILACSNYPSYDQNLYSSQYSEYSADPGLPLYNRALQGLYTPGSTFKPSVAVAALLTGEIDRNSTVYCNGVYNYFRDYHPRCTRHGHSGDIDVVTAIKWSCNIFFYDVGRRITSDVYDDYAHRLGLGTPTGVEVSESTGRLTTKEDENYTASLEVQAAIGQGNTVVTPVQLATYAATIANKGVRYRTHFVKALLDTNTGEVLEETAPEIVEIIPNDGGAFDIVEEGMVGAAQTVAGLANYPYTIACKTGTPQRSEKDEDGKYYTNSTIIAYGPVEDPQIAVGIVVEYGGGGSRAGELVADIFNAYFFERSNGMTPVQEGQLLE